MLILTGIERSPSIINLINPLEIQKFNLGVSGRIYMDATFVNKFQANNNIVFTNYSTSVTNIIHPLTAIELESNTLDNLYNKIIKYCDGNYFHIGDIYELKFPVKKGSGRTYKAELYPAEVVPISCLRRIIIDDILNEV